MSSTLRHKQISTEQLNAILKTVTLMQSAGTFLKGCDHQSACIFSSLSQALAQVVSTLCTHNSSVQALTSMQIKDLQTVAILLIEAGTSEVIQGYDDSALAYFSLCELIAQIIEDPFTEGAATSGQASAHIYKKEYSKAIKCSQKAIISAKELKRPDLEAISHEQLAAAFLGLGDDRQMLEHYDQALKLTRESGSRTALANLLKKLSYVNNSLAQYSKTIEYSQQARFLFQEMGDSAGESQVLYELGFASEFTGQLRQAIEYYGQCAEKARRINDLGLETKALLGLVVCRYR